MWELLAVYGKVELLEEEDVIETTNASVAIRLAGHYQSFMQTSLGGRAPRASRLQEVWLPGVKHCLETARLRAVPFPLVALGSPAITGLCLVTLTRPACLSWVLWHGAPMRKPLPLLSVFIES